MKKKLIIPVILLSLMVTSVSAVTYKYGCKVRFETGKIIASAYTDDPGMNGGKVAFWYKENDNTIPPADFKSDIVPLVWNGTYYVASHQYNISNPEDWFVRAHFQGEEYSVWSPIIKVPWLQFGLLSVVAAVVFLTYKKRGSIW